MTKRTPNMNSTQTGADPEG